MWISSNAQRTFSTIYAISAFYYFIYSSFIRLHFSCTVRVNIRRKKEHKKLLSIGFIVKHISTPWTQTNKCVIQYVFHAFFGRYCLLRPRGRKRERESTKKSQSKRHQPLKKIVSTVFWRWKLIRKVSVDLFWCPKYLPRIAISTYRLHRCKYTSHLIYEHIISVMWIFSIYILNEMRIDVAGGKNGNIHQTPSKTYQFLSEMTFCYLSPARDLAKKKRQTVRMACVAFVLSCQHVAEFYSIFSSGFSAVK